MSMMTENGTTDAVEVSKRIEALEKAQAVQAATEAGAQATQAATLAGAQATQAATLVGAQTTQATAHAGTWATMAAGSISLIIGMFLGLTISRNS